MGVFQTPRPLAQSLTIPAHLPQSSKEKNRDTYMHGCRQKKERERESWEAGFIFYILVQHKSSISTVQKKKKIYCGIHPFTREIARSRPSHHSCRYPIVLSAPQIFWSCSLVMLRSYCKKKKKKKMGRNLAVGLGRGWARAGWWQGFWLGDRV